MYTVPFSLANVTGEPLTHVLSSSFYMPFTEGTSSAKTIPAKCATRIWGDGGNFILRDPGNYIRWDSEQACSKRKLDQTAYGIPFQFELFDDSVTFIAIKCYTRTACIQSPSDMTDNLLQPPALLCICHFLRKASVRYFTRSLPVWEVSYFQSITITLATKKQSKMKKIADSTWKKILIRLHFPSFPPRGGGMLTLPHDTHPDTVFQQAKDTILVIQHSSAVTLLLALLCYVLVTRKALKSTTKRNKLVAM